MYRDEMKLISLPLSPFAARARAAIYFKDLPFEILPPGRDWQASGELRCLTPMAKVPILILDDGSAVPESRVIVDLLETLFPERPLRAKDPFAAARSELVQSIVDLYATPAAQKVLYEIRSGTLGSQASALSDLGAALGYVETYLHETFAAGDKLTAADFWVMSLRFEAEVAFGALHCLEKLDQWPKFRDFTMTIDSEPAMSRVWGELQQALASFSKAFQESGDFAAALQVSTFGK